MSLVLFEGLIPLPWWGLVMLGLLTTHLSIVSVTLYLHRGQAHRALEFHPWLAHVFRFWLWLTTGMVTREWVAVHRKHHARCETAEDPHSPQVFGLRNILWTGVRYYRRGTEDPELVAKFGRGTPDDWIERHLYSRYPILGVSLLLPLCVLLFGPLGLTLWAVQMIWLPFLAAGVVNGLGHHTGYRNFDTPDASTNLFPVGVLIGGEELHNNHHAYPSSARFALRPWEVDVGWWYLVLLQTVGLARIRRVAPRPVLAPVAGGTIGKETVRAVLINRIDVMARYYQRVILPVLRQELRDAGYARLLPRAAAWFKRRNHPALPEAPSQLQSVLDGSPRLGTVERFRRQLQGIWEQAHASQDSLQQALQEWCAQAEATGIRYLRDFADLLRAYGLKADALPAQA